MENGAQPRSKSLQLIDFYGPIRISDNLAAATDAACRAKIGHSGGASDRFVPGGKYVANSSVQ